MFHLLWRGSKAGVESTASGDSECKRVITSRNSGELDTPKSPKLRYAAATSAGEPLRVRPRKSGQGSFCRWCAGKRQQFACGRRFLGVIRPRAQERSGRDSMGRMPGWFCARLEIRCSPLARLSPHPACRSAKIREDLWVAAVRLLGLKKTESGSSG